MAQINDEGSEGCNGEQALVRGLRAQPCSAGARFGWEGFRICNWSTQVEEYGLPALPEWIVALHTAGACVDRAGADRRFGGRSLPGLGTIRPPGVSDTYRPRGPFRCTTAHVAMARVRAIAEAMGCASLADAVPYRFGISDALLTSILTALAHEIESPAQQGSLLADRLIEALVIAVLRSTGVDLHERPAGRLSAHALARVRERIEEGLAQPMAVADLAGEAGLSAFHFARAFKRTTGITPHRYVTQRRIEHAKSLLLGGDLPICRIALESGFASQQHFAGIFRRITGTPPAMYRRLGREHQHGPSR